MDPTYAVVEIQCLDSGWVYIDMWKEPLPAGLLRDDADIKICVRPWASTWTQRRSKIASGLCAEEALQVVRDERETIIKDEKGLFRVGSTEERIFNPDNMGNAMAALLMHVNWSEMTGKHPELKGLEPCCRGARNP